MMNVLEWYLCSWCNNIMIGVTYSHVSKFGYSDACVHTDIIEEPSKCVKTYLQ